MAHTFRFDGETLEVLAFVDRTLSYGVPLRVALKRAERRFDLDRHYIRALMRLLESDRRIDGVN